MAIRFEPKSPSEKAAGPKRPEPAISKPDVGPNADRNAQEAPRLPLDTAPPSKRKAKRNVAS